MKRLVLPALLLGISSVAHAATVTAKVVALDEVIMYNRLGSRQPGGMIYALARDVVSSLNKNKTCDTPGCVPGHVQLRPGKRPRPLVLRVNAGDDLVVTFTNLLDNVAGASAAQTFTRRAGLHIQGVEWTSTSLDDGSFTDGNNTSYSVPGKTVAVPPGVPPGSTRIYKLHAPAEGTYLLTSVAGPLGGTGAGQTSAGLFGALHVEPKNSKWYRSQVTNCELKLVQQGTTSGGQPIIPFANYDKVYGASTCQDHQLIPANTPVLAMLSSAGEIVHSDLTALIAGPNGGRFIDDGSADYKPNYAEPNRLEPFREFTIIYHSDFNTIQAFAGENPNPLVDAFNAGSDAFGINYGIAGIFAEIYANRIGVGPMAKCTECKFEEFFLSAWTVGDPAMVVDLPAYLKKTATKATYPDDPSNVYHSYLNDHVRFRILSADSDLHHIHHQHAHQWLHTPNSADSTYLDSQAIGPGSAFTLDISYDGSGNRNKTIGDSIFHCHFYPHFAQGMWSLWRVHDVFEAGTELDAGGVAAKGSRALPDGEIQAGTPIPGIVPLPSLAMAPMPSPVFIDQGQVVYGTPQSPDPNGANVTANPGYPFFIPGTAGQRATNPPLDTAKNPAFDSSITDPSDPRSREFLDGGLPRNLSGGGTFTEFHTIYNFSKDVSALDAKAIPEVGTNVEQVAMKFNEDGSHSSFQPDGTPAPFVTNGLPRQPGAPYADPCKPVDNVPMDTINYKAANIQLDVILNKKGWHYPQQRMLALWGDVAPTLYGDPASGGAQKAPEPFFFRANSGSCIDYWQTNLIPNYYELDNFQVRTPTDIIGQHIHLVKFDVTSSDGAANGFNYEDGTDSPQEVQERIAAINAKGGLLLPNNSRQPLTPVRPYFFCADPTASWFNDNCSTTNPSKPGAWVGARTTVQRWFADPLRTGDGGPGTYDRTLRTVFTHDHFSPSTHQQAGLYAGLLVEPTGSQWFMPDPQDPNKEILMGSRTVSEGGTQVTDGGPTSWQAQIHTGSAADSYREFALEFQDMQLAYLPNSKSQSGGSPGNDNSASTFGLNAFGWYDTLNTVVNPPSTNPPTVPPATQPQNPAHQPPGCCVWPQLISEGFGLGTYSLNYRNEPVPFRVWNPASGTQPGGQGGDLSGALRSIQRSDVCLNQQPQSPANLGMFSGPALTCGGGPGADPRKYPAPLQPANNAGVLPEDPYTPLIRAYQNDKVQIRVLVGSHLAMHDFSIPGLNWLFEPSDKNSGYRNTQAMGISEHFEFLFTMPPSQGVNGITDYPYIADNSDLGLQHGVWGLVRSYNGSTTGKQPGLPFLPSNPQGTAGQNSGSCPAGAPKRPYAVSAISADQLPFNKLIYNDRLGLYNKNALVYVLDSNLAAVKSGQMPVQPLVLRANAGDCIQVTLTNAFDPAQPVFQSSNAVEAYGVLGPFNCNIFGTTAACPPTGPLPSPNVFSYGIQTTPSTQVGLNPQLVVSDPTSSLGMNAGINPVQTACPKGGSCPNSVTYEWYAGELYDAWTSEPGSGKFNPQPVEFGAANLSPSDPSQQPFQGLFGALIIEPAGADYTLDSNSTVSATIKPTSSGSFKPFREFVAITPDNVGQMFTTSANQAAPFTYNSSVNYGAEPWVMRLGEPVNFRPRGQFNTVDLSCGLSNKLITSPQPGATQLPATQAVGEFATPVFAASAGDAVRFRVLSPPDGNTDQIFEIHGHVWQEEPYTDNSTKLGFNPLSQWQGSRMGHGSRNHFDILLDSAGGTNKAPGDYLYRTHAALAFRGGMFGTFRVGLPGKDTVTLTAQQGSGTVYIYTTVQPSTGQYATSVTASNCSGHVIGPVVKVKDKDGVWTVQTTSKTVCATSNLGGAGALNLKLVPEPCIDITKQYRTTDKPLAVPAASAADKEVEEKEKRFTKPDRFNPQLQN